MRERYWPTGDERDRAISEVLSYSFVFSLIVISIAVISVSGIAGLQNARNTEQAANAQQGFDVLHDNMADLYYDSAPSRATEISLGETEVYYGDNVTVNVTAVDGGVATTAERSFRPVVQRLEEQRRLVYEGGAVFRTSRDGGVVVEKPPHAYRSGVVHVTIPAMQAPSVQSIGGSNVLVRAKVTDRSVPIADSDGTYDRLFVNVTSPRYELWQQYLTSQSQFDESDCSVDSSRERVVCSTSAPSSVYVAVHEAELSLIQ